MNLERNVFSQNSIERNTIFCQCGSPVAILEGKSVECRICGKLYSFMEITDETDGSVRDELFDIQSAKKNIRTTLMLQKKRKKISGDEIDFLMKRL